MVRSLFNNSLLVFLTGVFLSMAIISASCKKPNNETTSKVLLNCSVEYLNYTDNPLFGNRDLTYPPSAPLETRIQFEYMDNTIRIKNGGFVPVPAGGNLTNLVFDENGVYDSLVFDNRQVKVYTKPEFAYLPFENPELPIIYQLDEQQKLGSIIKRDGAKLIYIYADDKVVEESSEGEELRIFYIENGNLVKVESKKYVQGLLAYKKELLFMDFDNNPNPLKGKYYILGAFYRAFCENNYTKYTINEYGMLDGEFTQISAYSFSMPIAYTSDGYPIYGDYEN